MNYTKITDLAHNLILENISPASIIVDATCGNGYDTLFLSNHVTHVYAFDIQKEAIDHTKELTKDVTNITLIHDTHEKILDYVKTYDGVIFNLGYLPGSDKKLTTKVQTTIDTLQKLHQAHQGFILITVYPGHLEGLKEAVAIQSFLDKKQLKYRVIKLDRETKNEAPYLFFWKY